MLDWTAGIGIGRSDILLNVLSVQTTLPIRIYDLDAITNADIYNYLNGVLDLTDWNAQLGKDLTEDIRTTVIDPLNPSLSFSYGKNVSIISTANMIQADALRAFGNTPTYEFTLTQSPDDYFQPLGVGRKFLVISDDSQYYLLHFDIVSFDTTSIVRNNCNSFTVTNIALNNKLDLNIYELPLVDFDGDISALTPYYTGEIISVFDQIDGNLSQDVLHLTIELPSDKQYAFVLNCGLESRVYVYTVFCDLLACRKAMFERVLGELDNCKEECDCIDVYDFNAFNLIWNQIIHFYDLHNVIYEVDPVGEHYQIETNADLVNITTLNELLLQYKKYCIECTTICKEC